MSCGYNLVKYLLFVFNLLCSICGILLIVFGFMFFSVVYNIDEISEAVKAQQVPITMIVFGLLILLITFFGCCGAIRESYCMSMTYAVLLFVLMIGQLALIIYMWLQKESFLVLMGDVVEKAWANRTRKVDYMDAIQTSMECCGKNSFTDYSYQGYYPPSCCTDNNCRVENVYRKGCKQAFVEFCDVYSGVIKFGGLAVCAVELIVVIFSCCLANNIRNYKRRSAY